LEDPVYFRRIARLVSLMNVLCHSS
jgi:hypothetical protein